MEFEQRLPDGPWRLLTEYPCQGPSRLINTTRITEAPLDYIENIVGTYIGHQNGVSRMFNVFLPDNTVIFF